MDEVNLLFWLTIPAFFLCLLYSLLSATAWPYARPAVPLCVFIVCILVPPLLPFLLLYALCAPRPVIVVSPPSEPSAV